MKAITFRNLKAGKRSVKPESVLSDCTAFAELCDLSHRYDEFYDEYKKILMIYHRDGKVLCRPDPSKTLIGTKFWCYRCSRYVLPDDKHSWLLGSTSELESFFPPSSCGRGGGIK